MRRHGGTREVPRCPKDIGCQCRGSNVGHDIVSEHAGAHNPEAVDMTKLRNSLILAATSALLCLPMSAAADTTVKAKLVELNGSGASGTATLTATDDGGLKVVIESQGLVPGVFHPQHLHGSGHGG